MATNQSTSESKTKGTAPPAAPAQSGKPAKNTAQAGKQPSAQARAKPGKAAPGPATSKAKSKATSPAKSKSSQAAKAQKSKAPAAARTQSSPPKAKKKAAETIQATNESAERVAQASVEVAEQTAEKIAQTSAAMAREGAEAPAAAVQGMRESASDQMRWLTAMGGANIEAMFASSAAAIHAGQEMQGQMAEMFLRNSEETVRRISSMADCRNADDLILMQSEWSKSVIEECLDDLTKCSDSGFRVVDEIIDPVAKHLAQSAGRPQS